MPENNSSRVAFESGYNYSFRAGHCEIILGLLRALREKGRSFVDGGRGSCIRKSKLVCLSIETLLLSNLSPGLPSQIQILTITNLPLYKLQSHFL